ncbi:hypothetical protein ZYGR_0AD00180 [Zygosaccharomyces rouxii]|uniref:Spindle pole body component n=2 Tax=Zygosaccharomyces rouxii TaxID=4956 RepID=C5DZQ4_ZYGRC|nr:uncharacterized protein ZYRO0G06358g [Zygosaccharomyces rouxii]KAH9202336.1 Spc98 family-domain-containing protein [Zygosaccharomyces rouxii]GAV50835.1 hypothetical protein ZYGR_0AD00180 [Zygosaccharomyces rouxii]CAR29338.1 ZYRO0G06358p [Zygosaccharomyces rouxii]
MDLEVALYPVVEALAPHTLSDGLTNSLTHELAQLLQSPSRSLGQLQNTIDSFKLKVPYSPDGVIRWQKLINVIQLLFGIDRKENVIKYLSTFQSMLMENSTIPSPDMDRNHVMSLNMNGLDTHDKLLSPLRPQSLQAESFENLDKFSDRRSLLSSQKGYALSREYNSVSLHMLSNQYYYKMISEEEILKVISYTLLATMTELFPLEFNKINIPKEVTNSESGLLHLIFEAVLLYQNLKLKVDEQKHKNVSPMKKALLVQVESALQNYVKVVNSLSAFARVDSLKQLYYEFYDHIIALRFHYRYMENFEETSGDSFLTRFNDLQSHGDVLVRRLCTEIFKNLLSLYYEYLIDWLTMGKLEATYREFFIVAHESEDPLPLKLVKNKVPKFIPMSVANEIFIIGKTFLLLSKYCKELHWTNEISKKYSFKYQQLVHHVQLTDFYSLVHSHYEEMVKFANNTLLHKFYYKQVLYTLKDILLMGKSDLIDILIQKAQDILAMPSASLSGYRLTRFLQEAVQQSSMRNLLNKSDKNFVINGLDARILDLGHGSLGWDVFTLDYLIDVPLSTVLNVNRNGGKKEYLRIFNFLWRFKKNNFFYNQEWLKSNQLIRNFRKMDRHGPLIRDLTSKLSKVNILRNQIQHFSQKLEAFCFRSIIDKNFQEFERKVVITSDKNDNTDDDEQGMNDLQAVRLRNGVLMLNGILRPRSSRSPLLSSILQATATTETFCKEPNIDELDSLHDGYLQKILLHKLLNSSNGQKTVGGLSGQPYSSSSIILLNIAFEFITFQSALNDVAHELLIQLNLDTQPQLGVLLSRFNSVLRDLVPRYKLFKENLRIFIKDLKMDGDDELCSLSRFLR